MQFKEAVKKYKTPVGVGYCLRYKPFITEVKNFLDNGTIGEVVNVEIFAGSYLPDWRPNKDYLSSVSASSMLGGGALLELSHEIDYANLFFPNLYLESAIIKNSQILNIDAEGHDFNVISDFSFSKYKPKLISIEHNSYDFEELLNSNIHDLLIKNKYFLASKYGVTCIYIDLEFRDKINLLMSV